MNILRMQIEEVFYKLNDLSNYDKIIRLAEDYRKENNWGSRNIIDYDSSNRYLRALKSSYDNIEIEIFIDESEEEAYSKTQRIYYYEIFEELIYVLHTLSCIVEDYEKIFHYKQNIILSKLFSLLYCIKECNIRFSKLTYRLEHKIKTCKSEKNLYLYKKLFFLKDELDYFDYMGNFFYMEKYMDNINNVISLTKEIIESQFISKEKNYRNSRSNNFIKRKERKKEYYELLNSYEYRTKKISKRDIAKILGVSPAAVTQFCKRNKIA